MIVLLRVVLEQLPPGDRGDPHGLSAEEHGRREKPRRATGEWFRSSEEKRHRDDQAAARHAHNTTQIRF